MEAAASVLSANLGLSRAVSRFLIADAASIPVSLLFRILPHGTEAATNLRHLFAALTGIILTVLAFGISSLPLVFTPVAIAYLTVLLVPKHCGSATFLLTFVFLIGCHVRMMSGDAWREGEIDCTGALMILVLKVISFAMDCQDGVRLRQRAKRAASSKEENGGWEETKEMTSASSSASQKPRANGLVGPSPPLGATAVSSVGASSVPGVAEDEAASTKPQLPASSTARPLSGSAVVPPAPHALGEIPSPLEFLGYSFCCALHFAGPFYFYGDYKNWIQCEKEYAWLGDRKQRQPPFCLRLLRALGQALLAAVVYLWLTSMLDFSIIFTPEAYFAMPLWRRAWLLYLAGTETRWKYYFIWSVSEAVMVASGLGFSGWHQKPGEGEVASWERAENCHIIGVELASSAALFAVNWNISVGRWLRAYVYERLVPPGKKPAFMQLLVTQLVAGVWHGLYPGYILFFAGIAWEVAGSRAIYKWQRLIPEKRKALQFLATAAHTFYAAFCNNFVAIGFNVLTARATLTAWAGLYFAGIILPALAMASEMFLPKSKSRKKKEA